MIKVNEIEAEPGCAVDGDVHGQYSVDKLADIAIAYGLALDESNDPRHWRAKMAASDTEDPYDAEHLNDAGEELLELLNGQTQGGFFEWVDGSVFLVDEDDLEGEDGDDR